MIYGTTLYHTACRLPPYRQTSHLHLSNIYSDCYMYSIAVAKKPVINSDAANKSYVINIYYYMAVICYQSNYLNRVLAS